MDFEIVECPRDAMQGIKQFIPTEVKVNYLRSLLKAGFDVLDCGSFVHPSAVPQMADTPEVIRAIESIETNTELLVIVANERGAVRAAAFERIKYLGYPFSVSETFQRRNTNSSGEDAFLKLQKIQEIATACGKEIVCYISMAFGNPYGDDYSEQEVLEWVYRIQQLGIKIISLADTTSEASLDGIRSLFHQCHSQFEEIKFGSHFHASVFDWQQKIEAALNAGCKRFDAAILGYGGCPFAKDTMIGNVPTEGLLKLLNEKSQFNRIHLNDALVKLALQTYNS